MDVLRRPRFDRGRGRRALEAAAVAAATLAVSTVVAAALESGAGVADASSVYLLAVVVMASRYGLWPAVATSLLSVLVYDLLFTAPRFALAVADPQEWLSLLLFLVVAVVIARLAALQADRAADATRRADEARALFGVSRSLATAASVQVAAQDIVQRLQVGAGMDSVWIALGNNPASDMRVAFSPPNNFGLSLLNASSLANRPSRSANISRRASISVLVRRPTGCSAVFCPNNGRSPSASPSAISCRNS